MNPPELLRRHLCFLDVGHGNCTVLIASDKDVVVVDVGQQSTLSEFLLEQKITHVQSIYLSHADADHIGALVGIIATRKVTIGQVVLNSDGLKNTKIWDDLAYELNSAHHSSSLKFKVGVTSGTAEHLSGDVQLDILGPSPYLAAKGVGGSHRSGGPISSNTISTVISVSIRGARLALLPGDLDGTGLVDLQSNSHNLQAPILVYPHHGGLPGRMSPVHFGNTLAAAVSPQLVIFSIGRGPHIMPNPQTVRTLRRNLPNVRIVCTQLSVHCARQVPPNSPTHLANAFARGRVERACCGGTVVVPLDDPAAIAPWSASHADFIRDHAETALCATV